MIVSCILVMFEKYGFNIVNTWYVTLHVNVGSSSEVTCLAGDILRRLQGCCNGNDASLSTTVQVLFVRMCVASSCDVMPTTVSIAQPPPVDVN